MTDKVVGNVTVAYITEIFYLLNDSMACFLRRQAFLCEKPSNEYFPWYEPMPLPPTPPNGRVGTKGKQVQKTNQGSVSFLLHDAFKVLLRISRISLKQHLDPVYLRDTLGTIISIFIYYLAVSHKDWGLLNSRIWLAEIDIENYLLFPIYTADQYLDRPCFRLR